jgi:hypothetical protein
MNLKDSFRYQNLLESFILRTSSFLSDSSYVTTTKSEHLKSKADPNAKDETFIAQVDKPFDCAVNTLLDFLMHLLEEKEKLTLAIGLAKSSCGMDIDASVAMNRTRQRAASALTTLVGVKSREAESSGRDFRINNEGNQTAYVYKIKEVITIDFDRNKAKALSKALLKKSNEISTELDRFLLSVEVPYEASFDANDNYEEVLEAFATKQAPILF